MEKIKKVSKKVPWMYTIGFNSDDILKYKKNGLNALYVYEVFPDDGGTTEIMIKAIPSKLNDKEFQKAFSNNKIHGMLLGSVYEVIL